MPSPIIQRWLKASATPLTALAFLIVGISGVFLFFHWFESSVKEMHELIGLLFVAAAAAHGVLNLKSMRRHFSRKLVWAYSAALTIVAMLFIAAAPEGPNPKRAMIDGVLNAPIELSAQILGTDKANLIQRLADEGIEVHRGATLIQIAQTAGISPFAIVSMIE